VCEWFAKKGFRACVLKGQGNAMLYPDPYSRSSGDIDVWVEGTPKEVAHFILQVKPDAELWYHHGHFPDYKGTEIEPHYRPDWFSSPWMNRKLQRWFRAEAPEQFGHELADYGFAVPTTAFNLVYQLCHIRRHVLNEGMALRPLMDYYYLLKSCQGNYPDVLPLLKSFGLMGIAGAVMYIMREVFGMADEELLVPADAWRGKTMLEEVYLTGNFGKFDARVSEAQRNSKRGRFLNRVKRDVRFFAQYPGECFLEPIFRTYLIFWKKCFVKAAAKG